MIFVCHNSREKHLVDEFRQDLGPVQSTSSRYSDSLILGDKYR